MKQSDLKSGITSAWLERAKSVSAATIGHEVWLDTEGYWHEKMKDGTEVKYSKDEAYTQMWTIVNKKDTIFKYIFWERLDSLPIPESCFHFIWC